MGAEPGEQLRFMYGIHNLMSSASAIIKAQKWRYTTNEFKDILKPLADAFRSLLSKDLDVAVIAVGEGDGQIFFRQGLPIS